MYVLLPGFNRPGATALTLLSLYHQAVEVSKGWPGFYFEILLRDAGSVPLTDDREFRGIVDFLALSEYATVHYERVRTQTSLSEQRYYLTEWLRRMPKPVHTEEVGYLTMPDMFVLEMDDDLILSENWLTVCRDALVSAADKDINVAAVSGSLIDVDGSAGHKDYSTKYVSEGDLKEMDPVQALHVRCRPSVPIVRCVTELHGGARLVRRSLAEIIPSMSHKTSGEGEDTLRSQWLAGQGVLLHCPNAVAYNMSRPGSNWNWMTAYVDSLRK